MAHSKRTAGSATLPPSGPEPGARLTAFPVDDVTGELPGQRLCYVCQYGAAPAALVFTRLGGEPLAELALELDLWRSRHPEARAFVVALGPAPEVEPEELCALARRHQIGVPLTLSPQGEFGPHLYRIHPRVPVTVVMYRSLTVTHCLTAASISPGFRARLRASLESLINVPGT